MNSPSPDKPDISLIANRLLDTQIEVHPGLSVSFLRVIEFTILDIAEKMERQAKNPSPLIFNEGFAEREWLHTPWRPSEDDVRTEEAIAWITSLSRGPALIKSYMGLLQALTNCARGKPLQGQDKVILERSPGILQSLADQLRTTGGEYQDIAHYVAPMSGDLSGLELSGRERISYLTSAADYANCAQGIEAMRPLMEQLGRACGISVSQARRKK